MQPQFIEHIACHPLMDQQREFAGAGTVWEAAAGPFRPLLVLERSLAEQAAALADAGDRVTEQALAATGTQSGSSRGRLQRRRPDRRGAARAQLRSRRGASAPPRFERRGARAARARAPASRAGRSTGARVRNTSYCARPRANPPRFSGTPRRSRDAARSSCGLAALFG